MDKRPFTPPRIIPYVPDEVPQVVVQLFSDRSPVPASRDRSLAGCKCTNVVDGDGRFVGVSESFCELLGYGSQELIGRTYDEITAPKTSDVPAIFRLFKRLGYMQGLWVFLHRTGKRILIRYESRLRHDSFIETNIEVVGHLR